MPLPKWILLCTTLVALILPASLATADEPAHASSSEEPLCEIVWLPVDDPVLNTASKVARYLCGLGFEVETNPCRLIADIDPATAELLFGFGC